MRFKTWYFQTHGLQLLVFGDCLSISESTQSITADKNGNIIEDKE